MQRRTLVRSCAVSLLLGVALGVPTAGSAAPADKGDTTTTTKTSKTDTVTTTGRKAR